MWRYARTKVDKLFANGKATFENVLKVQIKKLFMLMIKFPSEYGPRYKNKQINKHAFLLT